ESVAFSPDGKTLAAGYSVVGGVIGGVVLWDVSGRRRLAEDPLPVKGGDVESVAFSPGGKTFAAGYGIDGGGGGVVLWDVSERRCLAEEPLPVKEGYVGSVAFSPDGKTLAAEYNVFPKTLAAGYSVVGVVSGVVLWDVATRRRMEKDPLPV